VRSVVSANSGDREEMISLAYREIIAGAGGDMIEATHALARWSVSLLDVSGAGVMMADHHAVLRSVVVSSDLVRALENAELEQGRGPCMEAHRRAEAVIHADLDVADARWPQFGPQARAGGIRAVHAIPVLDAGSAVGVLNLFRSSTGALSDADADLAQSLADAAGTVASPPRSSTQVPVSAEDLAAAVGAAAIIERAKGMLAVRLQVDIGTAYAILRRVAADRGHTVAESAAAVVTGSSDIALPLSIEAAPHPRPR
jgi:GAF domain-containing protein